jgi:hypothetical protein
MKKITKYKVTAILAIVMVFSSCEDFLEKEPLGRYTQDTYPAGGGLSS